MMKINDGYDEVERENAVLQCAKLVCDWDSQQYQVLKEGYVGGVITPIELKKIVAERLVKVLEPVRLLKQEP